MNLQFYLEKLQESENFREFVKENPDAFLCSGFFVIDKGDGNESLTTSPKRGQSKGNDNKQHFDFWLPKSKKMISFQIEDGCKKVALDEAGAVVPAEISQDCDFDFEFIEKLIAGEMFEQKISNKIQKFLLSLQNTDGKNMIIGTVFISGMGLLKVNIDINEKKIIHFEKKSFFDMMKIVKK